jgi:hypothetical protein
LFIPALAELEYDPPPPPPAEVIVLNTELLPEDALATVVAAFPPAPTVIA